MVRKYPLLGGCGSSVIVMLLICPVSVSELSFTIVNIQTPSPCAFAREIPQRARAVALARARNVVLAAVVINQRLLGVIRRW